MKHLAREMPRMCAPGRLASKPWLPPESFHNLDLSEPSLLVPRIARSLRPVLVPSGVLPVNHNISIVRSRECTLARIEAWLCSATAQDRVRLSRRRWRTGIAPSPPAYFGGCRSLVRDNSLERVVHQIPRVN